MRTSGSIWSLAEPLPHAPKDAFTHVVRTDLGRALAQIMSSISSAASKGGTLSMHTALDAETGVRRARHAQPDLILLDIQMPNVDGYEACRRLKANPQTADIPVIFATGFSGTDDKLRAFEVGAVDYVTKPFERPVLLARVRAHLALARQRVDLSDQARELDTRVSEATRALRQESERLQHALAERDRFVQLLELQSEQLRHLTQRWVEDRSRQDPGDYEGQTSTARTNPH